jgi:hypothetical protein
MHPSQVALLVIATALLCGWYLSARSSSSSSTQTATLDVTELSQATSSKYDHFITPPYASFFQERLESSLTPGEGTKGLMSQLEAWGQTHKVHGAHPLKLGGEGEEWFGVLPHDGTPLECPPPCDVPTLHLPTYGSHDLVLVPSFTLEHWMDPEWALAVVQGHLAKGGWLVMAPSPSHPTTTSGSSSPPQYFFHTPTGLALLAERVGLHPLEVGSTAAGPGPLAFASVLLGRKSSLDTHAHLPAFKAVGAGTVEGYTSSRPILLHKEEERELWGRWVKGQWGWRPAGKGVWEEVRRALGESTGDARGAKGVAPHAHAPHNNAAPLCSGFTIEAGYYLAMASLVESFPLLGVRRAHNPTLLAHLPRGCLCTLVSHLWGGGECGEYRGGRPGAALLQVGKGGRSGGGGGGGANPAGAHAIVLSDFFEFVEDPVLAVREVYDSLAPGGVCFAVARVVAPLDPHTKGRVMLRTLSPMGLLSLFARLGFEVVAAQHWGTQEHTAALRLTEPPKFFSLPLGEDLGEGSFDTAPSQWEAVSMSWGVFRRPGGPSDSRGYL